MILLVSIALAVAGQTAETNTPAPAGQAAKPHKICRTLNADRVVATGSIMGPNRLCKTQEQWDKIDHKAKAS